MKFIRWNYVLPRLVVLVAIGAGTWYGFDPLVKHVIVSAGQAATGAKVDVAEVETSLWDGQVQIRGLQVANPQAVWRNLCEADQVELCIDMKALAQHRVVVRNGEVTGLVFGTDRSESGEIEITTGGTAAPWVLDPLVDNVSDWASHWLDQAGNRLDRDLVDKLQTPHVAQAIGDRWQTLAADLRKRAEEMKVRSKQLETEFREAKLNPLRNAERIPVLHAQLITMHHALAALQREITSLPEQANADRASLNAARAADEAFVKQQLKFERLDGDNLTQVLLGPSVAENAQIAIDWFTWARQHLATNPTKPLAKHRSRGTVVHFGVPQPTLHIERLKLALTAPVGLERVMLTGALTNVCDQPQLLAEPARLELVASGGVPVALEVISDHRGDVPREELFLVCSAIPLPGQTIGRQDRLAVQLAPGTANLRVELALTGDELSGQIAFEQPDFRVTPLATAEGNQTLVSALDESLGTIRALSAEVKFAGTLDRPEIRIESPIGQQLADGISLAVFNLASKKSEALLAKLTDHLEAQIAQLEKTQLALQDDLLAELGKNQQLVENLTTLGSGADESLSLPQLGTLGNELIRR